jgi:outer membrane protein, multidrug efflux system
MFEAPLIRPIALAALLAAVSCRTAPPADRSKESGLASPAGWSSAAAAGEVDVAWVKRFKDARLAALVEEAWQASPDLRAAAARVDQARANARAAGAMRGPQLDSRLNAANRKQNFLGFPIPGAAPGQILSSEAATYQLSLDIQWELDLWGRAKAGQSAALGGLQTAEENAAAARAALAAEVCRAWFALAEANQQHRLAAETVANTTDTTRVIRERFEAGQGESTGAQLRLALSDESSARAGLAGAAQAMDAARRRLEVLVARYPAGGIEVPATLPDAGPPPPAGLPAGLLARRPDLRAAERRFATQGARQQEARRALFPTLSLTGSYGTSSDALKEILNSDFGVWSLAGGIVQPIFYSGRILAEIDKRNAEEREALADYQGAVLKAFGEVETALAAEATLREREGHLREATRLATEADQEARADYRNGRGDALTVFSAQNRLIQTRRELAATRLARLDNRVTLHLALGGDFASR